MNLGQKADYKLTSTGGSLALPEVYFEAQSNDSASLIREPAKKVANSLRLQLIKTPHSLITVH